MGPGLHRADGEVGMAVGIGGDDDKVRIGGKAVFEIVEKEIGSERVGQVAWRAVDEGGDVRARVRVSGSLASCSARSASGQSPAT